MSIKEQIRAEIDRRYEENRERARYDDYYRGMNDGLDHLETFLDTLPEQPAECSEEQKEQKPWKVGANAYFTPEQKPKRERKKPKESWLEKAKYELEHADELLIKRQEELREIRELKNKEQKPAEWSEEDEENFKWFDKFFCAESIVLGGKDIPQDKYLWFKSLRPQPKQEWSEEDIKKIRSEEYTKGFNDAAFGGKLKEWSVEDEDRIRQIERIAQQAGCTQKLQEEIHDWLKSLRPQWQNG